MHKFDTFVLHCLELCEAVESKFGRKNVGDMPFRVSIECRCPGKKKEVGQLEGYTFYGCEACGVWFCEALARSPETPGMPAEE